MSQRYFLTAESTYEDLRQALNASLAYPNSLGKSVFQTALYAPRDSFRRVLLAVDTDLPGYATINDAITPLLASDAMEEIDEATYLAAVASASQGGGGAGGPPDAHAASHGPGEADELYDQSLNTTDAVSFNSLAVGLASGFTVDEDGNVTFANGSISFGGGYDVNFDGAAIANLSYNSLTDLPTLGTAAASDVGDFAAVSHAHNAVDISFAATDRLLGRSSSGAGAGEEITCTSAGRALLDDADAAAQRSTLSAQKTITSGTAAPTGGADGDIYLQYS